MIITRTRTREGETMSKRRVRLGLAQLLTMLLLTAGTLVAVPNFTQPAAAAPNGCTGVPDSGYGFNFNASCNDHDNCYAFKYFGDSASGRQACDVRFLNNMKAHCNTRSSWGQRTFCRGVAYTYYYGVRALGGFFFARATGSNIA